MPNDIDRILHTYVINLDRSPDRYISLSSILDSLGIRFSRVSAFDAQLLDDDFVFNNCKVSYSFAAGQYMTKSWICISLSHLKALDKFLESEYQYALILEDDAELHSTTPDIIDSLITLRETGQVSFESVELCGPIDSRLEPMVPVAATESYTVAKPYKTSPIASAMLHTRQSARKLLQSGHPIWTHWDNYLSQSWVHRVRYLTVRPFPIRHRPDSITTYREVDIRADRGKLVHKLLRRLYFFVQTPSQFLFNAHYMGLIKALKVGRSVQYFKRSSNWEQQEASS